MRCPTSTLWNDSSTLHIHKNSAHLLLLHLQICLQGVRNMLTVWKKWNRYVEKQIPIWYPEGIMGRKKHPKEQAPLWCAMPLGKCISEIMGPQRLCANDCLFAFTKFYSLKKKGNFHFNISTLCQSCQATTVLQVATSWSFWELRERLCQCN